MSLSHRKCQKIGYRLPLLSHSSCLVENREIVVIPSISNALTPERSCDLISTVVVSFLGGSTLLSLLLTEGVDEDRLIPTLLPLKVKRL